MARRCTNAYTKTPYMVLHILYSTLLCRYISSKVEPSFVDDIKMAAGFDGARQYVGQMIFMYKAT